MKKILLLITGLILHTTAYAQVFTVDENGIVKCPTATPGQKGTIFGEEFEAVDRSLLEQRRDEGADLSYVCTSLVTDMRRLFMNIEFNQEIATWDVSNVTTMEGMFWYSTFNQSIELWDVSKVTDMSYMFNNSPFNQPIGNWDVSSVTNMYAMFLGSKFNQPIGDWNVSKVTNMESMFYDALLFNQDLSQWNVSNVTSMAEMFRGAKVFNQPLANWDVSNVTTMRFMFNFATVFNQDISQWDVSSVTTMNNMFWSADYFNQDIGNWDVSSVTNLEGVFWNAARFNQDLKNWCVPTFPSEPLYFSAFSGLSGNNKPIWGTCPGRPETVLLISPTNNLTNVSVTPTLTWEISEGALEYELELYIGSNLISTISSNTNSYTFSTPLSGSTFYRWRVRGLNESANPVGEWSSIWRFLTETVPVGQVSLISPQNQSENLTPQPKLVWNRDPNATSYTIEISTNGFTSTTFSEITTDTSFTAPRLNLNTNYSWRVKATNSLGDGSWSEVRTFATSPYAVSTTGITYFVSVNGSNSTGDGSLENPFQSIQTAFDRMNEGDETNAILVFPGTYVGAFSANKSVRLESVFGPSETILQRPTDIGTHITVNGGFDTEINFQLKGFTLISSETESTNGTALRTERFAYSEVENVFFKGYEITLSTYYGYYRVINSLFNNNRIITMNDVGYPEKRSTIIHSSIYNTTTSITNSPPDIFNDFYNTIIVNDPDKQYSEPSFNGARVLLKNVVTDRSNSNPLDGSQIISVDDARFVGFVDPENDNFRLQNFSTAIGAGAQLENNPLVDFYGTSRPNPEGSNPDVGASENALSEPESLVQPGKVNLAHPTIGAVEISLSTELKWNKLNPATDYQVKVSKVQDLSDQIVFEQTVTDTSVVVTALEQNTVYYWQVTAQNGFLAGESSEIWSFTTTSNPVGQITLGKPDDQDVVSPFQLLFTWSRDSNANSYELEVSSNNFESFVVQESLSDTSYSTSELDFNTLYQWRVRALNNAGTGEWSLIRTFTTGQPIPGLIYPSNGATGLYPSFTFEWSSLENAQSYGFELRNTSTEDVIYSVESLASSQLSTTETMVENGGESISLASLLEYDASYQWRARLHDAENPGEWSEYATFSMIDSETATLSFNLGITVSLGEEQIPLRIGAQSGATSGYDESIDRLAPPVAPGAGIDARLIRDGESYYEDFIPFTSAVSEWRLQLQRLASGGSVTLTWNPNELPVSGSFMLMSEDRTSIRVDMRVETSISLNPSQQVNLYIQHVVSGSGSISVNLTMNSGWNLVGLPGSANHGTYTELFPGASLNTLYEYQNRYEARIQLQSGLGYWIRYPETITESISGEYVSEVTWNLKRGWNLVAGPSISVPVSSIEDPSNLLVPNTFFQYEASYKSATLLSPGRGYWVRSSNDGTVLVNSGVVSKSAAFAGHIDPINAHSINVLVASDTTKLFWGGILPSGLTEESYSLPPVPPIGVTDVRFENDQRWSANDVARIAVTQFDSPISIFIEDAEESVFNTDQYRVVQLEKHRVLDTIEISQNQILTLNPQTDRIEISILEKLEELPVEFTLYQNYPNPFNPTTTIRFGLPESVDVTLEVYSVLGQKVMTLISENRSAGWHTVTLNAADLSSGMYVYRIQAGGLIQTRTLLVVK